MKLLKDKEGERKEFKKSFSSLILKIHKDERVRVMYPLLFFARRLLTVVVITVPMESIWVLAQNIFIMMNSFIIIMFLVSSRPYKTTEMNTYALANEVFYIGLIFTTIFFSDMNTSIERKFGAAIALCVSMILLVLSNIIIFFVNVCRGRDRLKDLIKESNLKRDELESLWRTEEAEHQYDYDKAQDVFKKPLGVKDDKKP